MFLSSFSQRIKFINRTCFIEYRRDNSHQNMAKIKKNLLFSVLFAVVLLILAVFLLRFFSGDEDTWIKDARGIYIKHGVPSSLPDEVKKQQYTISLAQQMYNSKKELGMNFSNQCLGSVDDYAIDIVHTPRTSEDNLPENQCEDFRLGKVSHFIELDKNGNIVKIA